MNTNTLTKNKKRGFTLVELLVVIAILAILASVTVVGYLSFTKKAKDSNAVTELTQAREIIRTDYLNEGTHHYNIAGTTDSITATENASAYNLTLTYNQSTKEYTFDTTVVGETSENTITLTWDKVIKAIFAEDLQTLKGTFYFNVSGNAITSIGYASSSEGYAKWDIAEDEITTAESSEVVNDYTITITTLA